MSEPLNQCILGQRNWRVCTVGATELVIGHVTARPTFQFTSSWISSEQTLPVWATYQFQACSENKTAHSTV